MPTVLLHYCAGKGLEEEAGRRGKGPRGAISWPEPKPWVVPFGRSQAR